MVLVIAFILINVELGKEDKTLEDIKSIPEVKEAYSVFGVYDIVTRVETEDVKQLVRKIRLTDGVHSTLTMIAT
jgi:anthranilate phosphoribosyltransferase